MGLTIQCYEHPANAYGPVHEQCNGVQWKSPRSSTVIYCRCWCHKEDNDGQPVDEEAHDGKNG